MGAHTLLSDADGERVAGEMRILEFAEGETQASFDWRRFVEA